MAIANTNWYRNGTIGIAKNATKVYGTGTQWLSVGINPGATLRIDGTFHALEILAVVSDTEIDLRVPYTGDTITNAGYSIDRNFQSTIPADLAAGVAAMTSKYERYIDSDLQKITGESAYDIAFKNGFTGTESEWLASLNAYGVAKDNGFTGTESEWLNSLKAAGEWEEADTRISTLETAFTDYDAYIDPHVKAGKWNPNSWRGLFKRNMIRSRPLGNVFTDAQKEAIRSGLYTDLYVGDYWQANLSCNTPNPVSNKSFIFRILDLGDNQPNVCDWKPFIVIGIEPPADEVQIATDKTKAFFACMGHDNSAYMPAGYIDSYVVTDILPPMQEMAEGFFGADFIPAITLSAFVSSNKQQQYTSKLWLQSREEYQGTSMGVMPLSNDSYYYCTMKQFAFNKLNVWNTMATSNLAWLRDISFKGSWCVNYLRDKSKLATSGASGNMGTGAGVYPWFCLKGEATAA